MVRSFQQLIQDVAKGYKPIIIISPTNGWGAFDVCSRHLPKGQKNHYLV